MCMSEVKHQQWQILMILWTVLLLLLSFKNNEISIIFLKISSKIALNHFGNHNTVQNHYCFGCCFASQTEQTATIYKKSQMNLFSSIYFTVTTFFPKNLALQYNSNLI